MQTLEQFSPHVEVYSIDEAFLDLSGIGSLNDYGQVIRSTVLKHVGVPVCVGIAPTKTLAKLANYDGLAKSREGWKIIDYQVVQTIRRGEIVDPTQNMKASFSSDG
jgi:DNA polymerase V